MIIMRSTTEEVLSCGIEAPYTITESLSQQQQEQQPEQQQDQEQKQGYIGMARFGKSFADMAEAMLEDEYVSSHHLHHDLKTSTSSQVVNSFLVERNDGAGVGLPPSALKRKPSGEAHEKYNNSKSSTMSLNSDHATRSPEKRNPDSRSVVIQDPPKRQRTEGIHSAVDVVQSLNRALSQEDRLEALQNAIFTFDHDNRDLHDSEIAVGADIALTKALVFLEFKAGFRREPMKADMEAISREIGLVLKALECVYR
jgi:hypothetical protein